jgi:hypothetical protein
MIDDTATPTSMPVPKIKMNFKASKFSMQVAKPASIILFGVFQAQQ